MKKNIFLLLITLIFLKISYAQEQQVGFNQGRLEIAVGPVFANGKSQVHKIYQSGYNIRIGVNALNTNHFSFRVSAGYTGLFFNKSNYLNTDTSVTLNNVKGSSLSFISLAQDLKVIPFSGKKIAPYMLGGIEEIQGITDGKVTADNLPATKFTTGFRLLGSVGAGAQYVLSERINLMLEIKQRWEFLQAHPEHDLFYNFKNPDKSYNYLTVSLGLTFKWNKP